MAARLLGINTPEVRGPEREEGLRSKAALAHWLEEASEVWVESGKGGETGKFGRSLVILWADCENLNEKLIAKGLAEARVGDLRAWVKRYARRVPADNDG